MSASPFLVATIKDVGLLSGTRLLGVLLSIFVLTPLLIAEYGVDGFAMFSALMALQFILGLIDGAWLALVGPSRRVPRGITLFGICLGALMFSACGVYLLGFRVGQDDWAGAALFVAAMTGYPVAGLGFRLLMLSHHRREGLFIAYFAWILAPVAGVGAVLLGLSTIAAAGAWLMAPTLVGVGALFFSRSDSFTDGSGEIAQFLSQILVQQTFIAVIQCAPLLLLLQMRIDEAAAFGLIFRLLFPLVALDGIVLNSLHSRHDRPTSTIDHLLYLTPSLLLLIIWSAVLFGQEGLVLSLLTDGAISISLGTYALASVGVLMALITRRLALFEGLAVSWRLVVAGSTSIVMVGLVLVQTINLDQLLILLLLCQTIIMVLMTTIRRKSAVQARR